MQIVHTARTVAASEPRVPTYGTGQAVAEQQLMARRLRKAPELD